MQYNTYNTFKSLSKTTVGLDQLFSHVDQLLNDTGSGFPPFNLFNDVVDGKVDENSYVLELAVAGYSRENLSIQLSSGSGVQRLIVSGDKDTTDDEEEDKRFYHARGIRSRSFTRAFSLAENVRVDEIKLADGILTVKLKLVKVDSSTKYLSIT